MTKNKKRKKLIFTFLIVALIGVNFILDSNTLARNDNWGLSFPGDGEKPIGNTTKEELLKYDAYYVGDSEEKIIYLTFDAGYENGYTPAMLDTLKKMQVPAAFFILGTYARDNPELVNRMVNEGHIVANHTMTHPDLSKISSRETFLKEMNQTEEFFKTATGKDMPKYYRPPKGQYSLSNLQIAKDLGYKTIFWSLAYNDWNVNSQPSQDFAFSKLIPRIHPGAVLMLHNTSKTNSLILEELITKYREMGYEFRSLDELYAN